MFSENVKKTAHYVCKKRKNNVPRYVQKPQPRSGERNSMSPGNLFSHRKRSENDEKTLKKRSTNNKYHDNTTKIVVTHMHTLTGPQYFQKM